MGKTVLQLDIDIDFQLICISCHQKDYRLGYAINKALETDLVKQEDYQVQLPDSEEQESFSRYYYNDEENYRELYLLANKNKSSVLIPEQKQVDYLMQIYGHLPDREMKELIAQLKKIPIVLTAYKVDPESLKSKTLLIH